MNLNASEWEKIEREEHDKHYAESLPFDFKTYKIDKEHVLWWEDYCYKPGRRKDRGHRTKKVFEHLDLNKIQGKKILDIGCGNGQYSVLMAMFGAEVHGFDISPVGVSIAKKMAEENEVQRKCNFTVQNASRIEYPDETFDIVLLHEVLHHAIKYPGVSYEIKRVLKKGGKCILAESLDGNFLFRLGRIFTMKGEEAKGDVVLKLSDVQEFAQSFSKYHIETMSLFFMSKRIFQKWVNNPVIREILFLTKKMDDVLLTVFPFLKNYCGECVAVMTK